MSVADIIQIVIGILSLAATVAVSFLIYWLQTRHEKEIAKIEQDRQKRELEEKAHIFSIRQQQRARLSSMLHYCGKFA